MHRPPVSKLVLEPIPLERFLAMGTDDLRGILAELATGRTRGKSPLNDGAIESLIRVMDRGGYQRVSALGPRAAEAWAARVAIR
jgi:hypothetical protein